MKTTSENNRAEAPRKTPLRPSTILTQRQRRGLYISLSTALFVLVVGWRNVHAISTDFGYNMDLIFYTGCALEFKYDNIETIQKKTYEAIRKSVNTRHFKFLTAKNWKRKLYYSEPEHFANMLPFYRSRVMFTGAMYLLHEAGVSVSESAKVLNTGAYAVASILILVWLTRRFSWIVGPLLAAGLLSAPYLTKTARLATPDMLLTMWIVGCLFALIELGKRRTGLILLLLSLLIRPDSIIFIVLLVPALRLFNAGQTSKLSNRWTIGLLLSTVGIFLITKHAMDGYGWWIVLQYTSNNHNPHLDELAATFDIWTYIDLLGNRLKRLGDGVIFPHLSLAILGIYVTVKKGRLKSRPQYAVPLAVITICCVTRFILFPVLWDRLYLAYVVAIEMLAFSAVSYCLNPANAQDITVDNGK